MRMRTVLRIVAWVTMACVAVVITALFPSSRQMGRAAAASRLTIYGTERKVNLEPVLTAFQFRRPEIGLDYIELNETELDARFLSETAAGRPQADILLSSAMDRQVKLVNDGFAATHGGPNGQALPPWARWRNQAFAFTFEPAVMVFNTKAMGERNLPKSRDELRAAIGQDPAFWRERIGLYDIGENGSAYLIVAQETRQNRNFNLLLKSFGDARSTVSGSSAQILDRLADGELALGYNLLEPEAHRRIVRGAPLKIVYPRDYTLAVMQTAVIARNAPNPADAHDFLEFLLSLEGQTQMEMHSRMSAVHPRANQDFDRLSTADFQIGAFRPIVLGPGLLLYLDPYKRRHILESWHSLTGASPM